MYPNLMSLPLVVYAVKRAYHIVINTIPGEPNVRQSKIV